MSYVKNVITKKRMIGTLRMFPDDIQKDLLYDRAPFGGVQVIQLPDEGMLVLDTPEKVKKALDFRYQVLERAKSIPELFYWITKPNRLQIFEFMMRVYTFTEEDYNEILKDIWLATEFPHQMPIPRIISLFEQAKIDLLMTEEEVKIYKDLPESVTIFRGLQDNRAKLRGLSWTTKREVAEWFAKRWKKGTLYQAEINKKHIFMFTNERSEYECVVNPRHLKKVKKIDIV
jgi:hypothetical protein